MELSQEQKYISLDLQDVLDKHPAVFQEKLIGISLVCDNDYAIQLVPRC
jgi:hypothetical protein